MQYITIFTILQLQFYNLTILSTMEKLISMVNNIQEEIDPTVVGQFMKKGTLSDYTSTTRHIYLALSHDEKEKLITNYYSDIKSRGSGNFFLHLRGVVMPHRCFMPRESQKLICVHAEDNVMKSCFY